MKTISIIILNYNGGQEIINCLKSLALSKTPLDWTKKIIVVDNGSRDSSINEITKKFSYVDVIQNQDNLGFAGGMNVGIKKALNDNASAIMILNQDTILDPDCLCSLIDALYSDKQVGVVGPIIEFKKNKKIFFDIGAFEQPLLHFAVHVNSKKIDFNNVKRRDFLSGCCLLFTSEALEKVGLFEEKYFLYYEDDDWCKRARDKGFELLVAPKAKIFHLLSSSSGQFSPLVVYYNTRNLLLFSQKNQRVIVFVLITVYSLLKTIYFFTKSISCGKAAVSGMVDFFTNRFGQKKMGGIRVLL